MRSTNGSAHNFHPCQDHSSLSGGRGDEHGICVFGGTGFVRPRGVGDGGRAAWLGNAVVLVGHLLLRSNWGGLNDVAENTLHWMCFHCSPLVVLSNVALFALEF